MIPENKQAVVNRALEISFGTSRVEEILPLTKGLSTALVFKIVVLGKSYLLRLVMRTDAVADPALYFGCMQAAASAEIAPPVYYLNNEERISITGFIHEGALPKEEARDKMPKYISRLHKLPKFPFRLQYFDRMEGFMEKFRSTNMVPARMTDELSALHGQIAHVYPRHDVENWVSCHNDLKPENIIFDGMRPWFVDWESAFLNDPYLDLAMVAYFVVENKVQEAEFLWKYFGRPANEYEHARLFLMQQLLHIYYFTFFILFSGHDKAIDIDSLEKQDFRIFHDGIWSGEISMANSLSRLEYASVHRDQVLLNANSKRFRESLTTLSAHPVSR